MLECEINLLPYGDEKEKKNLSTLYIANAASYVVISEGGKPLHKYLVVWYEQSTLDGEMLLRVAETRLERKRSSFEFFSTIFKCCKFINYQTATHSLVMESFLKALVNSGKIPEKALTSN